MKKVGLIIVAIMLTVFATFLVACNNAGNDGNDGGIDNPIVGPSGGGTSQPAEPDKNAQIESVLNGEVSGVECTLEVSPTTEYIDLSGSITVSEGCSWQLYEDVLGQVNIPTKYAANLKNGYNTYYIVVTSEDGKTNRTYTLNIWRNFYVDIMFVSEGEVVKTLTKETHTYISNDEFISIDRTGYTHTGWTNHTEGEDYYITGYNDSHSSLINTIVFDAVFSGHKYVITLDGNGGNCDVDSVEVTYGSDFELPVLSRTGYTFDGWEYNGTKITTTSGSCITGFAYDKNITAKAKWNINSYQLTVNNDGNHGSVTSSGSRQYNSSVTITATPNAGYTFAGWYNGYTKVSDSISYTFTMPADDVTYTAKWEVNAEMQNFEFTSTTTTCTITGVKDTTLTSITIPDSVTSIGDYAFYCCAKLTSIVIPDSVTSIGDHAFAGCSSLTSVDIPDSVTSIGSSAFRECDSLTSVTIGDSVTTIGLYAFSGCTSLTSVTIGSGVTTIGVKAFFNCDSLTSIVIPDGVTSIGNQAFFDCDSLTSIVIPDSVTTIGSSAFGVCISLTDVYYTGTKEQWKAISIDTGNTDLIYAIRHYNYVLTEE